MKLESIHKKENGLPNYRWHCPKCQKIFSTRRSLYAHKKVCIGTVCQFCGKECKTIFGRVAHAAACLLNPKGLKRRKDMATFASSHKGWKMSTQGRINLSNAKKEYYKKHPEELPFVKWHSSKESYAEHYFRELFQKENIIGFEREKFELGYYLDFAFVSERIDFEVDGSQHYDCHRIKEHDRKRTSVLEKAGWKIIRVRWSAYQKLTKEEKKKWLIDNLLCHLNCFK